MEVNGNRKKKKKKKIWKDRRVSNEKQNCWVDYSFNLTYIINPWL